MMKYKLIIAYDGTDFSGWQVQPNGVSIQEKLQEALATILQHPAPLTGSGRTDAGVHALAQVAHFETDQDLEPRKLLLSLNGLLPPTIRVKEVEAVPATFHACHSANSKEYHYHLCLDPAVDPFVRLYAHRPPFKVSVPLLREAAQKFVGTHDFTTFANTHGSAKTSVRTITRIDVVDEPGGVRLEFEGTGFLYKMVRNIVGTLLEVASEKRGVEEISALFAAKDRRAAGMAAPARGLFLVRVKYPTMQTLECV